MGLERFLCFIDRNTKSWSDEHLAHRPHTFSILLIYYYYPFSPSLYYYLGKGSGGA